MQSLDHLGRQVSDAGVAHLKGLTKLRSLSLVGTSGDFPFEDDMPDDSSWPFRWQRSQEQGYLNQCLDRSALWGEQVEWVMASLQNPTVKPLDAPCNEAWTLLVWAVGNEKPRSFD